MAPTLISLGLHLCYCGSHLFAHSMGLVSQRALWGLIALYLGQSVAFYGLVRSGLSRRLGSDPALTQAQLYASMLSMVLTYTTLDGGTGVLVGQPLMMLMFGAFALTPRQTRRMAVASMACLLPTIAWCSWRAPTLAARHAELYHLALACINLSAATALALRLSGVMKRLRQQRAEIKSAMAQIQAMAVSDQLTGLSNRHHLHERLAVEHDRAERSGVPLCVGLFDLDSFKSINDTHGHATGDQVLRDFAAQVRAQSRSTDVVGRWGGEEFLILLPGSTLADARTVMDRLRLAVQAASMGALPAGGVTVSGGVAQHRPGESIDLALDRADQGLYAAKVQGRNRVCAQPMPEQGPSPSQTPASQPRVAAVA